VNLRPTFSDQELVNFFNYVKLFGESESAVAGKQEWAEVMQGEDGTR